MARRNCLEGKCTRNYGGAMKGETVDLAAKCDRIGNDWPWRLASVLPQGSRSQLKSVLTPQTLSDHIVVGQTDRPVPIASS
jgi:hypothetical protein